ncbi:hypothetical protein F5Y05DRAFT_412259 [Hypoxylon sp. FL0543]|nr:hypothetical protein F5Y05DRAFT_412259 [Hypoxylon sp. FL0543]
MPSIRSDEPVNGSVKQKSHPKRPEDPRYSHDRLSDYFKDTARPFTGPNSLHPSNHSKLFESVGNLPTGQDLPRPSGPATNTPPQIAEMVKYVEGNSGGSSSGSTDHWPKEIRLD